jgi:hypothetical protein
MISKFRPILATAGTVAVLALPFAGTVAAAQDRAALLLPIPEAKDAIGMQFGRATPGVTVSSPLAFGPSMGDLYVGGAYMERSRYKNVDDLTLMAGFGFGDPIDAVGVEAVVTSVSTFRAGARDRVMTAFKASRMVPYGVAIAVGIEGVKLTGGAANNEQQSVFAAASRVFDLNITGVPKGYLTSLTVNAGAGNGRFCPEKFVNGVLAGVDNCRANFFVSGGLRVADWLGAVADWYGQDLALSASVVPLKKLPIVLSPGIIDVTGSGGDRVRFVMGFGMAFKY